MSLLGGRLGTVDKAFFLVGKTQGEDGAWTYEKKPAEVLINPEKLRVTATTQAKKGGGRGQRRNQSRQENGWGGHAQRHHRAAGGHDAHLQRGGGV